MYMYKHITYVHVLISISDSVFILYTCIQAPVAHSLALSDQYLFCGCSEGVVRIFDPYTLDYIITMPLPHTLGVNVAAPADSRYMRKWHVCTCTAHVMHAYEYTFIHVSCMHMHVPLYILCIYMHVHVQSYTVCTCTFVITYTCTLYS